MYPSPMETLATFLIIYLLGMLSSLALTRLIQRACRFPSFSTAGGHAAHG